MVKSLIKNGANVNEKDQDGNTPLIASVRNGSSLLLHFCFEGKVIAFWIYLGRSDIAKLLIENGANVNVKDRDGNTALVLAVVHGNLLIHFRKKLRK